jgi:hypothetical protein
MSTKDWIEFSKDDIYPFKIEQFHDGWAGSGFDHEYINLKIRKVSDGKLQIEISIDEVKGKRVYTKVGSVELPVELVEKLKAILWCLSK